MISSELIGRVIPLHGYTPVFCLMGILHPLALILIWKIGAPKAQVVEAEVLV